MPEMCEGGVMAKLTVEYAFKVESPITVFEPLEVLRTRHGVLWLRTNDGAVNLSTGDHHTTDRLSHHLFMRTEQDHFTIKLK